MAETSTMLRVFVIYNSNSFLDQEAFLSDAIKVS